MYNRIYELLVEGLSLKAKEYKGRERLHADFLGIHNHGMSETVEKFSDEDHDKLLKIRSEVPQNKNHGPKNLYKRISRRSLRTAFKLKVNETKVNDPNSRKCKMCGLTANLIAGSKKRQYKCGSGTRCTFTWTEKKNTEHRKQKEALKDLTRVLKAKESPNG